MRYATWMKFPYDPRTYFVSSTHFDDFANIYHIIVIGKASEKLWSFDMEPT